MPPTLKSTYWQASRSPRYSLTFALPLLVGYELLAFLLTHDALEGVRNGADVLLKSLFVLLGGRNGLLVFGGLLLGTGAVLVIRDRKAGGPLQGRVFAGMVVESLLYATLFGSITSALTGLLLQGPRGLALAPMAQLGLPTQLMVSLGAGIYEELLFRVILVSALAKLAYVMFGWGKRGAGVFATIIGALIFSAFHYIGPLGDTLQLGSFVFRTVAGLLLSGLYLTRGFGIAAWTHALYDVILTLA